jgi:hypothetical protein
MIADRPRREAGTGWPAGHRVGDHGRVESAQPDELTTERPDQSGAGQFTAGRARGSRSAKDMALSMAVLLVPVFLLLVGYRVFFAGDAPIAVDAAQTYATARHSAHFAILEPRDLPPGWTPIASKFGAVADGSVLRVSYVTPGSTGVQLVESDRPVDSLLPDELGADAQPGNLTDIAGTQWRVYPAVKGGGRALVLAGDGYTTILSGTATDGDMRTIAAALH